jgi:hypothetical protein
MQIILKPLGAALIAGAIVTLSVTIGVLKRSMGTPPTTEAAKPVTEVETRGRVGVGTWCTEAEFSEIRLDGKPITLVPEQGKWVKFEEGHWHQQDATSSDKMLGPAFLALSSDPQATNYTLTLKARKLSGTEGFLIPFYVRSKTEYLWWNLGGWGNTGFQIEHSVKDKKTGLINPLFKDSIETGRWYSIKLECKGAHIKAYLDDKLVHDVTIPAPK